ncbi:MAG: asparagine synthase (glutamine-hydrolyzing) [Flavobacteriales bacterium]|nr:asparagine synthase (glutamine-hydrolyzing) [Flavobacteriales bacterium]
MCGINGIYQYAGRSFDTSIVQKMNETLAHRGPDAEGLYDDAHIVLGHRRLSIIDPEKGSNQPFKSADGRYVMVFNGEIYNYREIKSQLADYPYQTKGDTEVVLAAYIKYGENCLRMFNGMFAFAIWDSLDKKLFIARDRLGIKPLYYYRTDDRLIFSSSIKSILNTGLIPKKLSKESLIDYMRYQTVHAPQTIIEGVYMLMPGQTMTLNEEEGTVFRTYWSPTRDFEKASLSLSDVQEKVRTKLSESVERRLTADVPFGAFLSGGIDSSIIVAMMAEQLDKVDTFSVVFKEDDFSEAPFAREIAQRYQTNHHEIELSVTEFKDLIPTALSFMDHPSGDGPNTFVVSKKTREAGIKMALSGLGGDELFGGYSVFNQIPELQAKKWLDSFPYYMRKPLAGIYHGLKGTIESAKIKEILKLQYFDLEYIYQFYRQVLMDDQIKKLVSTPLTPNRSFNIVHDLVGYKTEGWNLQPLARISVAEMSTYMQNVLLRDADQMSMANGLELRVPFLDHELVSYVLGVSDKIKKPITPKKLLVDSCKDLIPESIYNREKMGFVLPYEKWMKEELRSYCEEQLEVLKKINYISAPELDKLWKKFLAGHKSISWSRLWPLVVLGYWIKENQIDG